MSGAGARRAWWRRPLPWILLALTVVPFVLAYVPGVPAHGYGHVWLLLPAWFFWRKPAQRPRLALYALGWGLQTLAYPAPDQGWLGWVLLLPYLAARERDDGASWWRAAWLYGLIRSHAGFYWLGNVHFAAWLSVSVFAGLAFALVVEGFLRRARAVPFALRAAVAWLLFEWVHSWLFGGFPWLYVGHTQYRYPVLIQVASLTGVAGVSFLLVYAQAAAWRAWRRRRATAELAVAGSLLAATLAWGWTRPGPPALDGRPRMLLVQTAFPHSVKEQLEVTGPQVYATLVELTGRGLAEAGDVDLVVWPETMHPHPLLEARPQDFAELARDFARRFGRPVIYGLNTFDDVEMLRRYRGYNAALFADAAGRLGAIYRKQRLVPMGEEFLLRRLVGEETANRVFDWMVVTFGYPRSCDLQRGEGYVTLDAGPGLRCAVLICFEGLYEDMAREAVERGDADLVLHLVNNGWFGASWEAEQMLASWVFRAVETRRPFVSCANGGVSCAVDATGRIRARLDGVMRPGTLVVDVPPPGPESLFRAAGPWPFRGALALAVLGALAAGRWRRRSGAAGKPA